jgi:hypothetical protein
MSGRSMKNVRSRSVYIYEYCPVSTLLALQLQPGNMRYKFHMAMNLKIPVLWPVTAKHYYVTEEGSSHNQVRHR